MRKIILLTILHFCAACVYAAPYESAIGVTFPEQVASLIFTERTEFPQKELGVNLAYQRSGPIRGSIYIYSAGLSSIPDGVDAPILKKHFEQTIREVKEMETRGRVKAVRLGTSGAQVTNFPGCGPQFIWRGYEIDFGDDIATSYTYLTAMKDKFVKLRISVRKDLPNGERDAKDFVLQIRKILGACKN